MKRIFRLFIFLSTLIFLGCSTSAGFKRNSVCHLESRFEVAYFPFYAEYYVPVMKSNFNDLKHVPKHFIYHSANVCKLFKYIDNEPGGAISQKDWMSGLRVKITNINTREQLYLKRGQLALRKNKEFYVERELFNKVIKEIEHYKSN